MKRKRAIILLICMCMTCIFAGLLSACGGGNGYENASGVKVVFELEGGRYKNSGRAPTYYYDLKAGASSKLLTPDEFGDSKSTVTNQGYRLEGWFRTKTVDEETGEVTYSEPWDFENDTITSDTESVTLYAMWKKSFVSQYELCYWDEAGQPVTIATYQVAQNAKFAAYNRSQAEKDAAAQATTLKSTLHKELVDGKGAVVYYDKDGNEWDPNFTHPGDSDETVARPVPQDNGNTAYVVQIFVKFDEGTFTYVSTTSELTTAIGKGENIVLLSDIDFKGGKFSGFCDYSSKRFGGKTDFSGNPVQLYVDGKGHSIKNFTLDYGTSNSDLVSDTYFSKSLVISIFGIADNVKVTDLSFTDVKIEVKTANKQTDSIYVAPLAVMAKNSVFDNVTFEGTYKCTQLPKKDTFTQDDVYVAWGDPIQTTADTDNNTVSGTTSVRLTEVTE